MSNRKELINGWIVTMEYTLVALSNFTQERYKYARIAT
jgi:hypothetical protein